MTRSSDGKWNHWENWTRNNVMRRRHAWRKADGYCRASSPAVSTTSAFDWSEVKWIRKRDIMRSSPRFCPYVHNFSLGIRNTNKPGFRGGLPVRVDANNCWITNKPWRIFFDVNLRPCRTVSLDGIGTEFGNNRDNLCFARKLGSNNKLPTVHSWSYVEH